MAGGFQNEKDFQDFQSLNPADQLKYLHATDPDFGKLPVEQQNQYVDSILGKQPAAKPPDKYGFTGGNMLRGLGEGVKGVFQGGYDIAKDLATNPNWVMGENSTAKKFISDPAAAEATKAGDTWKQGHYTEAAGHELAGAIPMIGPWAAHLGEKAGTGDVGGALAEGAGTAATAYALPKIRGAAREAAYSDMPPSGKGPQLTPFAKKVAQIGGGAAGAAVVPSPLRYEGAVGGYMAGPEIMKKVVGSPELGSIKNPGEYSKIPLRVPKAATETPVESEPTQALASLGARRGGFPRPHLPLVATPEEVQIFENRMPILKDQARIQGLHSAAFGKVGMPEDYPTRVGRDWMRPYGGEPTEPVDLQDTDLIPRKKTSGQ